MKKSIDAQRKVELKIPQLTQDEKAWDFKQKKPFTVITNVPMNSGITHAFPTVFIPITWETETLVNLM